MTGARRFDAAVVGSGPNGLTAAIRLAEAGRSVVVYEARETPGGGARTDEATLPGFRHDLCSAIHPLGAGSPVWRDWPLAAHGLDWIHPGAPLAHPLDDGSAVVLERSLEATAAGLGPDAAGWQRLLGPLAARWEDLVSDALGPLRAPRHPVLLARFGRRGLRSAAGLARSAFAGERARALFAGLAAHSVLPLGRPPSAAIGLVLGVAGHAVGWPLPRGGAGAIGAALAGHLRSLGGVVELGRRVGSLAEVASDGPVLFDTSPAGMCRIAGEALPARYHRAVSRYRYGPGVFKVDWALDAPIPWRAPECARAGTVHVGGTLEEIAAAERAAWRGEHAERPMVLVAQQSLFDPSRAPAGRHTGWAYCHVPNGSTRDRTDAIETQVERFAPGFRERILARHTTDCAALEASNPNCVGGDVNGGAAILSQLFTRPTRRLVPYRTPNPRLLLCSAATPPGGGVHGLCGEHAARAVLRG